MMKEILMSSWYIPSKFQTNHFNSFLKYAVLENSHPQREKYTAAIMAYCVLFASRLDEHQNPQKKPIIIIFKMIRFCKHEN